MDVDTKGATAHMGEWRRDQEARSLTIKVDVDTSQAAGGMAAMRRQLETFGRSDLLRLNLGAIGISAITPALTGLAQLASALQQVSQAALVVPGGIVAAGASFGTLAVGLSGVKAAYDAVSKAAQSSGQDSAAQARASAAAENQLRNAVVDSAQARKDQAQAVRDARNEMRDLNVEMRGGLISESRAVLEAQKAREDLARGKFSDLRDAQLRVLEADQRVLEVRARNADTAQKLNDVNAKGVENSDRVVAANERVVRSDQQVAEAHAAVAAASDKQSASQKAAAEAMDHLSPSAQKFVQQLIAMQPLWDRLRNSAQEPLFEGKAEEFEKFANDLAPHFEAGMSRISAAWNDNITALFTSIGSTRGTGLIDRILGNTGDAQERLSKAIDPLVRGVGTLAAAGTDSLPRLADALGTVAARFANFIEAADKDGRLDKWINDGLDGMASLGESVLNIGKAFTGITQASGGGFLQWLERTTDRMQRFLNSTDGQNKLKEFFTEGREMFEQWKPVLEDIPGLLKGIHEGAVVYIGGMLKVIAPVTDALAAHPGLIRDVAVAFAAWKTIDGVTSLIGSLGKINDLLGSGGRGGRGGKGILGKLALITVGGVALDQLLNDDAASATPPGASDSLSTLGSNVAAGAGSGALVAGVPGAIAGGAGGVGKTVYDRAAGDLERGRAEADRRAAEQAEQHRNDTTGPYAPPQPGGPLATAELRDKVAAGALPGYSLAPDGSIIGPDGKALPAFSRGGATPSGRGPGPTGGYLAEVHGDEWVANPRGRAVLGDAFLEAANRGLVVPKLLPRFAEGGVVDQYGNPVNPGAAPGPAAVPNAPIASNPTSGGGGIISSLLGGIASGSQGLLGNAIGLVSAIPGVAQAVQGADAAIQLPDLPAMTQAGTPGGDFASRASGLPGFAGLFAGMASPDPKGALTQWAGSTLNWLGNWGMNTATSAADAVLTAGGRGGVLGFFGLNDSILSPSNPYNQAATQVAGFALGSDGPFATLAGLATPTSGAGSGLTVDPTGLASQYGVTLDANTLQALYGVATPGASGGADWEAIAQRESSGNWQAPSDNSGGPYRGGLQILDSTWQQFGGTAYAPTADKATKAQQVAVAEKILAAQGPGAWPNTFAWKAAASSGSGGSGNGGLQINTLKGKQAIQANFPWATNIGGVRADALKWHPSGLALDVMIPGAGGLNDPTPAAGKAQGDQLYAWLKQHQSELGIDYIMWQQKDHFNHLHVNFAPSGFPGMESGGPTPSRKGPGPTGGFLAEVHPDEFMISARGRATVPDAFLHKLNAGLVEPKQLAGFAPGGAVTVSQGLVVPPPRPNFQVPNAKTITPAPAPRPTTVVPQTPPSAPTPAPAPQTVAPVAPTPSPAAQAPATGPAAGGAAAPTVAPAPKSLNHNLDWINTAIQSGAATLGNLAATAASMGIGAAGGGPLGGLAGSLIAGGFQQGGKIVQGLANVVSSALVGSVPGSFGGEPGARAYGQSVLPEQSFPDLRMSAGGNKTYNFNGISDVDRLMNRMELADKVEFQAEMANHFR
ncbi:MAG: transglycosylase family protein [Actinomycetota bacterium]